MNEHDYECADDNSQLGGFLAGLLIGGLAGAGAMLFLAPQSGKKTRATVQKKGIELRDQMVKTVEDASAQVRDKVHQISEDVQEQAEDLQQRGQDAIDEQRDNLSHTLKDLGKAVKS